MELKTNETKKFEDLTVSHTGGGHKILMDEKGKRSGDISFADITLQTTSWPAKTFRLYSPKENKDLNSNIAFDNYIITVKNIEWNGRSVKLQIERRHSLGKE